MYLCVYVSVSVHGYVYVYVYVYVYLYINVHIYYICVYVYVHMYMDLYMYIFMYTNTTLASFLLCGRNFLPHIKKEANVLVLSLCRCFDFIERHLYSVIGKMSFMLLRKR